MDGGKMIKVLLLLYLIWGLNWVVMKAANAYFPPLFFVACRFALGASLLLGWQRWRSKRTLPLKELWPWLVLTGILQYAVSNVAAQIGMTEMKAGLAAMLNYTTPLWVALLAHFLLGERLTLWRFGGIMLSFVGIYLLMDGGGGGLSAYALLVILGAVAWALAAVIMKRKLLGYDLLEIVAWQMAAGVVFLLGSLCFTGQGVVIWNFVSVFCLLYNGVLASAIAFLLWAYILKQMEAGVAAISTLIVPIIGIMGGHILLGEEFTPTAIAGMVLTLLSIALVAYNKQETKENRILIPGRQQS